MKTWQIIFLAIILILLVNKLTLNIRFDIVKFNSDLEGDFYEYRLVMYYWSRKHNCRKEIVL